MPYLGPSGAGVLRAIGAMGGTLGERELRVLMVIGTWRLLRAIGSWGYLGQSGAGGTEGNRELVVLRAIRSWGSLRQSGAGGT